MHRITDQCPIFTKCLTVAIGNWTHADHIRDTASILQAFLRGRKSP
jgi:hypothetical protein